MSEHIVSVDPTKAKKKKYTIRELDLYDIVCWESQSVCYYGMVTPTNSGNIVAYFHGGWEYNKQLEFERVPSGTKITIEVA